MFKGAGISSAFFIKKEIKLFYFECNNVKKKPEIILKAEQTIERYEMLTPGETVLCAFSGGPDSVFLLHMLFTLKENWQINLHAFHVHHHARGKEADSDAEFCRDYAALLGVPFTRYDVNARDYAAQNSLSFEEAGRILRMEAYKKFALKLNCGKVATGHTADDQAETLLMRIISGSGKTGLAGIYPVYEGFLIRPLLDIKKADIIKYLDERSIPYRIDSTNLENGNYRSRVRNCLIPFLKTNFNPEVTDALCRLAHVIREEVILPDNRISRYLDEHLFLKDGIYFLDTEILKTFPPALIKQILREAVKTVKGNLDCVSFKHTENLFNLLSSPSGSSVQIPGGLIAEKEYDKFIFKKTSFKGPKAPAPAEITLPGIVKLPQWGIIIKGKILVKVPDDFKSSSSSAYFDADSLGTENISLTVRARRPGDRFFPFGAEKEYKLKDFIINEKIPRRKRDGLPIIENKGVIIWVVGVRRSNLFRVRPETKRVLKIEIEKIKDERNA